jgi:hypothetical protein
MAEEAAAGMGKSYGWQFKAADSSCSKGEKLRGNGSKARPLLMMLLLAVAAHPPTTDRPAAAA